VPTLSYSGSRAIADRRQASNDAQSFAQVRTLRISQLNGFDSSTGSSISPLRAGTILLDAH
jgi:hypothetical protein